MRKKERAWAQALLTKRKTAATVLAEMKAHFASTCTLASKVSLVRKFYLTAHPKDEMIAKGYLHPTLEPALERLERASAALDPSSKCARWVRDFLEADAHKQYIQWSKHDSQRFCFKEQDVEAALKAMKILPDRLDGFRIDKSDFKQCLLERERRTLEANERLIEVRDGDALVEQVAALLTSPETRTYQELIVGLCGCSGRRMSEVANPHTTFEPFPGSERGVLFGGQLKKSSLDPYPAYAIPLVGVTAKTFLAAARALRKKQGDALAGLSISEIGSRYQSNISKNLASYVPALFDAYHRARKTHKPPDPPPKKPTLHDLRGFYAYAAFTAFAPWRKSFPRVLMYLLGHASMKNFFNYDDFDVDNFTLAYGPFPEVILPHARAHAGGGHRATQR